MFVLVMSAVFTLTKDSAKDEVAEADEQVGKRSSQMRAGGATQEGKFD